MFVLDREVLRAYPLEPASDLWLKLLNVSLEGCPCVLLIVLSPHNLVLNTFNSILEDSCQLSPFEILRIRCELHFLFRPELAELLGVASFQLLHIVDNAAYFIIQGQVWL